MDGWPVWGAWRGRTPHCPASRPGQCPPAATPGTQQCLCLLLSDCCLAKKTNKSKCCQSCTSFRHDENVDMEKRNECIFDCMCGMFSYITKCCHACYASPCPGRGLTAWTWAAPPWRPGLGQMCIVTIITGSRGHGECGQLHYPVTRVPVILPLCCSREENISSYLAFSLNKKV